MTPAQVALRLDALADELAARRPATPPHRAQPGPAIPLGLAVAELLHTVSGDVRARAAQACSGGIEAAP